MKTISLPESPNRLPDVPAFSVEGVAKVYGRTVALRATTLELAQGQVLVLLGPNGSGKTTLLKILGGAVAPTLGHGTVLGRDLADRERLAQVGLLAAESYLYEDLTARENLHFTVTMAGRRPQRQRVLDVLAEVGLERHAGERVRGFSSGMRRRLSLGRLLLLEPRLWLMDEPYNSLDAGGAELVDTIIRRAAGAGETVLVATHDAERALALADQVAVLERGAIRYRGTPAMYWRQRAHHLG